MNALVTGASSGIGKEMVLLLAQRGYHVVMVARREELMNEILPQLAHGGTVICQDLGVPNSAALLYQTCQQRSLKIDVLINNAGFGRVEAHCKTELESLERMNHLNITCLSSLCRLFGEQMKQNGAGCILNVGSIAGYLPVPFMANYAAGKAFVNSFTRALRAELRPHGVQVSLLNPGVTRTEFGRQASQSGDLLQGQPGEMSAMDVAEAGITGLFADHAEIVPGPLNQALPLIIRLLPKSLLLRVVGHMFCARLGEA